MWGTDVETIACLQRSHNPAEQSDGGAAELGLAADDFPAT